MRILAISDIHGCLNTFKSLLKKINYTKQDHLFLIGDFIDRGPDSKGVIDYVWRLKDQGYSLFCIRGNHEQMLLNSLMDIEKARFWLYHGGANTIASFGVDKLEEVPKKYISWIENLSYSEEFDQYIFVHAGLNFDHPNPMEAEHSMLWIRNWYDNINYDWLDKRIIVHGHTPISKSKVEEMFKQLAYKQVLDIDAGCVFNHPGYGHLCAVDLTNQQLYFQARAIGVKL